MLRKCKDLTNIHQHWARACPGTEPDGLCELEGSNGRHSELLYDTNSGSNVVTNAACEVHEGEVSNSMLILQRTVAPDVDYQKVEENTLFDSGASVVMISEAFCNKLQLQPLEQVVHVFLADGQVESYKKAKLKLVDRVGMFHDLELVVIPHIGDTQGVRSINPLVAASVFNRDPTDFDAVSRPLDILLGHVLPSIILVAEDFFGESCLYGLIFSTGWLKVSVKEIPTSAIVACMAVGSLLESELEAGSGGSDVEDSIKIYSL